MKFEIFKKDCLDWMKDNKNAVNCIITSPPYNIDAKYGDFDDSMPREEYLIWMDKVASMMQHCLKKNGQILIKVDPVYFRPTDINELRGDPGKARKELKWKPKTTFKQLVKEMMSADLKELSK